jgi:hypothetical protein
MRLSETADKSTCHHPVIKNGRIEDNGSIVIEMGESLLNREIYALQRRG